MYLFFIAAYIAGVVLFIVMYENEWAAAGFSCVIVFIVIRLCQFVTPPEKLYHVFPPMSWSRAIFQGFFFLLGFTFVGLALFCMARGIQFHQRWAGDSFFCGMTGMAMAAKWAFFLTTPIYELRPDVLSPEVLAKIKANGGRVDFEDEDDDSFSMGREPFLTKSEEGIVSGYAA